MSTPAVIFFGLGLGLLLLRSGISPPRRTSLELLRDQAIEAQRASARASAQARELAARWSAAIAEEPRR